MVSQLLFILCLGLGSWFFYKSLRIVRRNILLGLDYNSGIASEKRWKNMFLVAMGQQKMFTKPIPAVLHLFVYVGFILINIDVLEILADGLTGEHRIFRPYLGNLYIFAFSFFEILAFLVIVACIIFIFRRHVIKVKRFSGIEMKTFPTQDAITILLTEIVLMSSLILLNAVDEANSINNNHELLNLPVSQYFSFMFINFSAGQLIIFEKFFWWLHFIGILAFMNYIPYSKHFHILMAFPNTYYYNVKASGTMENMTSVNTEVKLMLDPSMSPPENYSPPSSFGVKDITDLTWKNLLDAYSCTECGRCTSVCPANITGKKLSPRKIMMDTRDRLEEYGRNISKNGNFLDDKKNLHSYISEEELWACTTCQACVGICPININPLEIILGMRRYKIMEQSSAPQELNIMFSNIENNGAPWQFSQSARYDWVN